MVCGGGIGFRAPAGPLPNKLHRTRSMPVLVSYIVDYMDREAIPYIERDIRSMLAAKQRLNSRWWLDFETVTKNPGLGDFTAQARCADYPVSA